jgi:ribosomal-protein-alanine N-acetyltransferase
VGIWFVVDEAHVISIGVRREERRRGVGELLLLGAFEAARRRQMDVLTLEVRKSNSGAQALYAKYGFREVGLRKKYYVDNGEDAIIMTTPSIGTPAFAERLQRLARGHAERWGRASAWSRGD